MNTSFYDFWHYGSRYGEIPLPYFGVIVTVSLFAFVFYIIISLKEILENDKQNILW